MAQEAGISTRGSTLIYYLKENSLPDALSQFSFIQAFSQRPEFSKELRLLLFPFTAIFNLFYFNISLTILSSIGLSKFVILDCQFSSVVL